MTGVIRSRVVRYFVVPLLVGGAAGWVVARLPHPWPLIIMVAGIVAGVIALLWSVRDLHRSTNDLEELVARMEQADGRVAYLMTDEEDGRG
jgi:membrane protein implicated in regulation of membrane protease activity